MPAAHDPAKRAVRRFVERILGRKVVATALLLFVVGSTAADVLGFTTKAWAGLKSLFQEKTSQLTAAELEVVDEWVALLDTAGSFEQAEAYRRLLGDQADKFSNKKAGDHFTRNLRVVRDPESAGTWLLVADITPSRSSKEEIQATIECVRRFVVDWKADDIISPWLAFAKPYDFSTAHFAKTYGRIKNLPPQHSSPDRGAEAPGQTTCPPPYDRPDA